MRRHICVVRRGGHYLGELRLANVKEGRKATIYAVGLESDFPCLGVPRRETI